MSNHTTAMASAAGAPIPKRMHEESLTERMQRILEKATSISDQADEACVRIDGPMLPELDDESVRGTTLLAPPLRSLAEQIEAKLRKAEVSLERLHRLT